MAVALRQSRRFAASSPVTRYWLANCVGFAVSGAGRGTVERVIADDDPFTPSQLEIRTNRHRLRRVPTSAVVAVVPAERLLVVERNGRPVSAHAAGAGPVLRRGAIVAARVLLAAATLLLIGLARGWELTRAGWRVARPVLVSATRRGWSESATLVRSVPWQRYGLSARSVTTNLWQARSTRSSRRPTTSSEPISAKRSEDAAGTTSST